MVDKIVNELWIENLLCIRRPGFYSMTLAVDSVGCLLARP